MIGPQRPQDMGLDQAPEGQDRRLTLRRTNERLKARNAPGFWIGAAGHPRPKGGTRQLQITRGFGQRISRLVP